jgi:hypothetical protein
VLHLLFARTHPRQMKRIQSWAQPSKLLTAQDQAELSQLFNLYDDDGSGDIDASELKEHLMERGMNEDEVHRMFDAAHLAEDGVLLLQDFQIFYREIWNGYVNFQTDTTTTGSARRRRGRGSIEG